MWEKRLHFSFVFSQLGKPLLLRFKIAPKLLPARSGIQGIFAASHYTNTCYQLPIMLPDKPSAALYVNYLLYKPRCASENTATRGRCYRDRLRVRVITTDITPVISREEYEEYLVSSSTSVPREPATQVHVFTDLIA